MGGRHVVDDHGKIEIERPWGHSAVARLSGRRSIYA